jgi:ankyrin repeat protein
MQKMIGIMLLSLSLSVPAIAAQDAKLADEAERHDWAGVRALLQKGADVNAAQVDGTTALHWAVYNDDAETVAALLRAKANVKAVNRFGVPPLALACTNGNAAIVKLLLEAGADANATMNRPHAGFALWVCRHGEGASCRRRQN